MISGLAHLMGKEMFNKLHNTIREIELKDTYKLVESLSGEGYQLKHVVTAATIQLVFESVEAVDKYALRKGFVIQ
jgi:hypothetical protein